MSAFFVLRLCRVLKMKILISINSKFFSKSPEQLIDLVANLDKGKCVSGFEMCIDSSSEIELNYSKKFAELCKNNNYYLQIHGNSKLSLDKQFAFMDYCQTIAMTLDYSVNIVLHPLYVGTVEDSVVKTNEYFSEVIKYIYENKYDINITIENLNSSKRERLNKEHILSILGNNEKLGFTYDIGHEIMDFGNIVDLDPILIEKLSNVHIHTHTNLIDHMLIFKKDINKAQWVKGVLYLKSIDFDNTIVLEYDFFKILGDSYKERLKNYVESALLISQYFY